MKKLRYSHEKQLRLQKTQMKTSSTAYDYHKSHKRHISNQPISQDLAESLKHRKDVNVCITEVNKVFDKDDRDDNEE